MPNEFRFGGVCSANYGVKLLEVHAEQYASRDYSKSEIKGRSGDFITDNDRLKNITLVMTCAIVEGAEPNIYGLNAALLSLSGYQRLEHTDDAEHYRMAVFKGGVKPRIAKGEDFTVFELEFDCKPQRFLKAGEHSLPQITGTGTPLSIAVAEGAANEVLSSAFIADVGDVGNTTITVLNTTSYKGVGNKMVLHYSDERLYRGGYILGGTASTDPTTTSGTSTSWGGMVEIYDNTVSYNITSSANYSMFETPIYYEIADSLGDIIASVYPTSEIIVNPTKFPAKPLIKLHISSTLTAQPVCMINDASVTLTAGPTVQINQTAVTASDIYIDCETMNAYSPLTGLKKPYNRNGAVYAPDNIELVSGQNVLRYNNAVDYIEIVPRWWTL